MPQETQQAATETEQDIEVQEEKKSSFNPKFLWLLLLLIPILAVGSIIVANAFFSPENEEYVLPQDGISVEMTLDYNNATAGVNYKTKTVITGKTVGHLPTPQLKGYKFVGWYCDDVQYTSDTFIRSDKPFTVTAKWVRDFTCCKGSPLAVFGAADYSGNPTLLAVGEYATAEQAGTVMSFHIETGYKLLTYSKENFEGDETAYVYDCDNFTGTIASFKIVEIPSDAVELGTLTGDRKVELLKAYAPRIWMAEDEEYMPSTVETAMPNLSRVLSADGYIFSQTFESKDEVPEYFYGNLKLSKAYSFFIEKDGCIDLAYFQYYPFNLGKSSLGGTYYNHVGDWEHVTIRLKVYTENSVTYVRPVLVAVAENSNIHYYSWDSLEKAEKAEQHIVLYSALGSHSLWTAEGEFSAVKVGLITSKDVCSQGSKWDLWAENKLETYSYDSLSHTGEGIGASEWNTCFDTDVYSINSNAVYRWGNERVDKRVQLAPVLDSGSKSPQFETVMSDYYGFG